MVIRILAFVILFTIGCQPLAPSRTEGARKKVTERISANSLDASTKMSANFSWSVKYQPDEELDVTRVFIEEVKPILDQSCLTGNCHAQAEFINLAAFPFKAEG